VSHDRLKAVAQQRQQIVDEPALGLSARNRGLENVGVANLFDASKGFLALQTIDGGLYGGVSWAIPFWEGFLNFADGAGPTGPQHLHNLKFQLG
jgi:hypothetical protein